MRLDHEGRKGSRMHKQKAPTYKGRGFSFRAYFSLYGKALTCDSRVPARRVTPSPV